MFKTTKLLPFFIYTLSVIISIVFILYIFATISENDINNYFNSDSLYLASIYKDIFIDKGAVQNWYLSPAPGFFPDMVFYFLLMSIFKNFVLVSMLYAIIQYCALLLLLYVFFKLISSNISFIPLAIANLSMMLFFMVTTISKDFIFTSYLINNAFHFGSFIMCLICLIFTFNFFKTNDLKHLIYLCLFGIIAVVSDRLFIVLYSLPVISMCIVMFNRKNKKVLLLTVLGNVIILSIGLILFAIIKNSGIIFIGQPNRILEYNHIGECFSILKEQFGIYLTEGSVKSVILWLSFVSLIATSVFSIKKFILYRGVQNQQPISEQLILCYALFFVFFIVIVFLAPVVNGSYTGFDTIRYNIYVLYLAIFNAGLIAMHYLKNIKRIGIITSIAAGSILITLLFFFNKNDGVQRLHKFVNYYPEMVRDIDSLAGEHNLKYGVAGYWDAKFIMMFSRKNLRVYAVYDEMTPYYHATNSNWFYDSEHGKYNHPLFNFVLTDRISNKTFFSKTFGDSCQIIKTNLIVINKVYNFKFDKSTYLPVRQ